MRRQLIVNAALVALALGTLAAVWATRDAPTTSSLAARKDKLLPTWDRDAVTRLVLRREGRELELIKDSGVAGGFRIVKPWAEPADAATVSALLGSLELASALRPAAEVSRDSSGLAAPSLEIRLEMAGKRQVIALGSAAPAPPGARYLELTSHDGPQRRYVISKGLVTELDLPWSKFREPRLLEYGKAELAKIQIEGPAGKCELEQRSPGVFYWHSGGGAELANPDTVERVVTALSRFSSEELVEPDVARAGLGAQALRIRLELKESRLSPITFTLGGQCGAGADMTFALRERHGQSARAGCVPRELGEALNVTPELLVLSRPFAARMDEVEELRITRGDAKLELARKGAAFLLRAPGSGEVPLDTGNQRLAALLGAPGRIMREPKLAALGLEPAGGEVVIRTAAGALTQRVAVGKPQTDGTLCLRRESDAVVLCLEADAARAFEPDASLLRSLQLLSFAASDVSTLSVVTVGLEQSVRRTPDGGFELEKPAGFRHDGTLLLDLIQTLGTLRAERWVSARSDASHGLTPPRSRVSIELSGDGATQRRELSIGAKTHEGFFASLSPDPGVFVLARATVLDLEQLLLERALCPFPASELRRIEIELRSAQKRVLLERRNEVWRAPGLSAERARELGETLAALRAEVALHVGAERREEGLAAPGLVVTYVGVREDEARRLRIGKASSSTGQSVAFARLDRVDATFALSGSTASALQSF